MHLYLPVYLKDTAREEREGKKNEDPKQRVGWLKAEKTGQ